MDINDLPFSLWVCDAFPLDEIYVQYGCGTPMGSETREHWIETVKRSIMERGLMNPLLIFNHEHPRSVSTTFRLKCWRNRYEAVRRLGWTKAPVIGTGEPPRTALGPRYIDLDYANRYLIRNGRLEPSGQGLRMTENTHPSEC